MKKITIFLSLAFLAILIIPILASGAIHGPNECCELNHNLTDIDSSCDVGNVVAGKGCDAVVPVPSDPLDSCNCVPGGDCDCRLGADTVTCDDEGFECWCDVDGDERNDLPCKRMNNIAPFDNFGVTKSWGTCCLVDTIYNITDLVSYILLSIVGIIYIIAGYLFVFTGGDPYKRSQAQNFVMYGTIGLVLALLSKVIPAIVKSLVA